MIVTKVELVSKNRYKVEVDGEFAFVLYRRELSHYQIKEECEVSEESFEQIKKEVIIKRAKLRAMHLLNDMDRTESQLRTKLRQSCYTEDVVEAALAYVKSFGYIDDLDYAKRYIQNRQNQKSKRELYAQLVGKGIERELIELAMEECYTGEDDEIEAIRQLAAKRKYHFRDATREEQQKQTAYFMRKGFSYENIRRALEAEEVYW